MIKLFDNCKIVKIALIQNSQNHLQIRIQSYKQMLNDEHKKQIRFYVSTGASLFTALALYQTLKFQTKIINNERKRQLVNEGIISKPSQVKNLKKGELIMVSGTVDTLDHTPIKIQINKKNQLLALRLLYKENIYSNESYDLSKKDYNINLREVLKGSDFSYNTRITLNEGANGILVKNVDKIDFSSALDIFRWENKKRDLSLYENLTVLFLSLLRGVATIGIKDPNVTFLRGIEIGTRQVEAGIKIGASLTVLGTLGVTTDGVLFIEPSSIFKQRLTFLNELNNHLEELQSKRNFWLAAFVVGAIYVGRRTYNYIKKNNIKMPWQKKTEV